jgi:predicted nucleotidyltransferase
VVDVEQIASFARRIAREFRPQRIVLFGSHARGEQGEDSDADLLVVIPHDGKGWRVATAIRNRLRPRFPLDIIVRSPEQIRRHLAAGDPFIKEIVEQGRVLHEASDQ